MNNRGSILLISISVALLSIAGAWYVSVYLKPTSTATPNTNTGSTVSSYDDCVAAGYPILESYPTQCITSDGKSFTQYIGNELEKTDRITITAPRPNTSVATPLTISGTARGSWFFEASFPIMLTDTEGNVLATGTAQAQGEWTTENFVPYTATLTFSIPEAMDALLTLSKDNPSGLAENDDSLIVPVRLTP